jgi:simple sugar transport system permease protein
VTFWLNSVSVGIVLGTPLAYAALGELLAERAGVMNLGVEGMMLMGAVVGFIVTVRTQNAFLGMAAAVVAGAALASVHAVMTVGLRVNQIVMGLTLTILGAGLSAYLGAGYAGRRPGGEINAIPIPVLSQLPVVGSVLFDHDVFVYALPFIAIGIWLLIYRTRFGLWLRAAGEHPGAADASGVPVFLIRYLAVMVGGGFAGLAGAYFSVVYTHSWAEGMTGGRGWIAIALVIFGTWNPIVVLLGALVFGFVDGLNFQFQSVGVPVSTHLLAMMPYVFTLVVLTITWTRLRRRRVGMPESLGLPYEREAR